MFVLEKDLREKFWENYRYRKGLIKYQFEVPLRTGAADLLTVESYQENIQLNAFEFKLTDIKKALAQAEANLPYVNRSWIVVPADKKKVINERYLPFLQEKKYIGAIGVADGGRWEVIYQPRIKYEFIGNSAIVKLLMARL